MSQTGQLIVLSGPSGVGKGTLKKRILEKIPQLTESLSTTTRAPRAGETDGVDYDFVDHATFQTMVANGDFVEYAAFADNWYGTPKKSIESALRQQKSILFEIDVQGALQIKTQFPKAYLIFIAPPSIAELRARLEKRNTNSEDDINRRLAIALSEMELTDQFDCIITNHLLGETEAELINCISQRLEGPQ